MTLPSEELLQLVRKEAQNAAKAQIQKTTEELRTRLETVQFRLIALEASVAKDTACRSPGSSPADGGKSQNMAPKILEAAGYAALQQELQDGPVEVSRPESLFCYCAFELAVVSATPGMQAGLRRAKLMSIILLLVTVEFLLATELFEASTISLYKQLWSPPGSQGPSSVCFYKQIDTGIPVLFGSKTLGGQPRIEWVVAAFCCLVVLLTVKADDRQLLAASYPKGMGLLYRLLFFLIWSMRTLYRCAWITSATVLLVADTSDIANIIMNSVAVTFLLEIDDLAYSAGLSVDAQEKYQQSAARTELSCQPHQVEAFSWCFFGLHGISMASLYLFVQHFASSAPHSVRARYWVPIPCFVMVVRSFLFNIASERTADHPSRAGLVMSIVAKSMFEFVVCVATGLLPWIWLGFQSDPNPDFGLLASCLDGSDRAACMC